MILLEVKNLTKTYKDGEHNVKVLKNINLTMQRGEFVSIQGVSGAGKSTFLNILGALDFPDKGDILVNGQSLSMQYSYKTIYKYRRKMIGFIFQSHYLMADFTVLENVMLPLQILGREKKHAQKKAEEILDKIGLKERMTHYPTQISGGESQRVAVARAMVHSPALILADEPTGNLDSTNTKIFINLLKDLQKNESLTILMVTHEKELANTAQTRYNMQDGELHQS